MIIKPKPAPNRNSLPTHCPPTATCDTIGKDIRIACRGRFVIRAQKGQ